MAKSALPWLQRLCALYEKHEPSVYGCTAEVHSSGVLVSLELDRGSVHLLAQPKARSGAYASTASMDIAIHHPEGAGPMPGNGELVARQFIALLQRADKGDIRIQSHGVNTAPVSDEHRSMPRCRREAVIEHEAEAVDGAADRRVVHERRPVRVERVRRQSGSSGGGGRRRLCAVAVTDDELQGGDAPAQRRQVGRGIAVSEANDGRYELDYDYYVESLKNVLNRILKVVTGREDVFLRRSAHTAGL